MRTSRIFFFDLPFLAAGVLLGGCASSGPSFSDGMPVEKAAGIGTAPASPTVVVLQDSGGAGLKEDYRKPVIHETRVFAVWVPEHLDEEMDLKVGAHWVYFKLAEARWALAGQPAPDDEPHPPMAASSAGSRPLEIGSALKEGLKSRGFVIPYREEIQGRSGEGGAGELPSSQTEELNRANKKN